MKKILRIIILATFALMLTLGMTSTAFANGSIHVDPKTPVVDPETPSDDDDDKSSSGTTNSSTTTGTTYTAAPSDTTYNGSPSDVAKDKGYDSEKMQTTDGLEVNLKLYDRISDVIELGETKNGVISYELEGTKKVTIRSDVLKGLKKSDVMIMIVNPDTGEVFLISPLKLNSDTGTMTFETPSYGKLSIIQKIPLVVRDVHPEEYPNLEVAASIEKLPEDEYIELREWLEAFGVDDGQLEIDKDKTIDVDDYNSANCISDIAVQLNEDAFGYKLNTRVWANLYQDINECDWGRVLDYAGVDYDADELKKDPTKLKEIEPFVLKDTFIYHVDAQTGEVSIAFEPEIKFDTLDNGNSTLDSKVKNEQDKTKNKSVDLQMKKQDDTSLMDFFIPSAYAQSQDSYTEEEKEIMTFDIDDIDERNTENLCMVMTSDQYLGMGPFALFMPKEKTSQWWIWLILILLVLVAIFVYYRYRRNKKTQVEE